VGELFTLYLVFSSTPLFRPINSDRMHKMRNEDFIVRTMLLCSVVLFLDCRFISYFSFLWKHCSFASSKWKNQRQDKEKQKWKCRKIPVVKLTLFCVYMGTYGGVLHSLEEKKSTLFFW